MTKNHQRRLINAHLELKKMKNMRKNANRQVQVVSFSWLQLDADSVSYVHICRKYPDIANQKSWIFIGKIMNRGYTWSSHQSYAKHATCIAPGITPVKPTCGPNMVSLGCMLIEKPNKKRCKFNIRQWTVQMRSKSGDIAMSEELRFR